MSNTKPMAPETPVPDRAKQEAMDRVLECLPKDPAKLKEALEELAEVEFALGIDRNPS